MVLERDRTRELQVLFDVGRGVAAPALTSTLGGSNDSSGGGCSSAGGIGSSSSTQGVPPSPLLCSDALSAASANATCTSSHEVQTFNRFAQTFARGIADVSGDIVRLTQLTAKQSVFDDQSAEVNGLTQKIKAWLQQLHDDLVTLDELKTRAVEAQKRAWQRRTRGDGLTSAAATSRALFSTSSATPGKSAQRHGDVVVDTLKYRLARSGQAFRATLQQQSRAMKSSAVRRHLFTAADRPQTFESALFQDQEQQQQQQHLLLAPGATTEQYYRQRMAAVAEIEASVAQVGELFSDFSRLVQEQGETVVRIDTDVDDALRNVHAGSNELMRYLASISSNRGLIVKLLAILFVFLLFFGLVVVK